MTLREVGSALRRMQAATLSQLAAELASTPREIEPLLAFWEHRGDVRRCGSPEAAGCGTSCRSCPIGRTPRSQDVARRAEVYEWIATP
ncbi:MAG: FeoC-like transcriptional regulator [Spirochaetota bacterium]